MVHLGLHGRVVPGWGGGEHHIRVASRPALPHLRITGVHNRGAWLLERFGVRARASEIEEPSRDSRRCPAPTTAGPIRAVAAEYGRDLEVWMSTSIVVRQTEREAFDYLDEYAVAGCDVGLDGLSRSGLG
jgi:hypothetical protein